ncbi:hypothetical protein BHE74_00015589 [Ensete ventricosum]|nr:hypothetical protein BHE74_00015589 [Ensete ventricosum]
MWLGTRQECIGSSSRVSRAYQDGVREFARRRPRLTERLPTVAEKLVESWDGLVMDATAGGQTAQTLVFGWLSHPSRRVNRPYSDFSGEFDFWL